MALIDKLHYVLLFSSRDHEVHQADKDLKDNGVHRVRLDHVVSKGHLAAMAMM